MTCTIWTSSLLETWTISTSLWLKCSFETNALREWDAVKRNPSSTPLHRVFYVVVVHDDVLMLCSLAPDEVICPSIPY
jgi:hypothetical protein